MRVILTSRSKFVCGAFILIGIIVCGFALFAHRNTPLNPIILENQQSGSIAWKTPALVAALKDHLAHKGGSDDDAPVSYADQGREGPTTPVHWSDTRVIKGYTNKTSINKGEAIELHISTTQPSYKLEIFRMGWYNGTGSTLLITVPSLPGTNYGVPVADPVSGIIVCNWPVAYTVQSLTSWVSGAYLAVMTTDNDDVGYVPFVVRDDSSTADILYQLPIATYQAYNDWGGKSLYDFNSNNGRASKVSYDRPYELVEGAGNFFDGDYQMIRFLESKGYNVSYVTSVDLERDPNLMAHHKMFLSNFHDEYWSWNMRTQLEDMRDQGKHIAIFSSNNVFWQVRFGPSDSGEPNRVMTCYKDKTKDPMAASATPWLTTVNFRDAPVNRPENELLGVMYEDNFDDSIAYPFIVQNSSHWFFEGTGLHDGDQIPGVISSEYDNAWNNGFTPANVTILSNTPIIVTGGVANPAIYTAPSGAMIFDASTNIWALFLDDNEWESVPIDARIQRMTTNLLNKMLSTVAVPIGPKDTIGVYRPSDHTFYLKTSNAPGLPDITVSVGNKNSFPVTGDWDGDGYDTVGYYDQALDIFVLYDSNTPGAAISQAFVYGNPGDIPLSGRWVAKLQNDPVGQAGKYHDGVGVFRPSNGLIYLLSAWPTPPKLNVFADYTIVLGNPGWMGLAGQWKSGVLDTASVFDPTQARFYMTAQSCAGLTPGPNTFCLQFSDADTFFGAPGDKPFKGDFLGFGRNGIGVMNSTTGVMSLKYSFPQSSGTTSTPDLTIAYGGPGDIPLAGHWKPIGSLPQSANAAPPASILVSGATTVPSTAVPKPTLQPDSDGHFD